MSVKIKQNLKIRGHGPKNHLAYILSIDSTGCVGKGNRFDLSKYFFKKKNYDQKRMQPDFR